MSSFNPFKQIKKLMRKKFRILLVEDDAFMKPIMAHILYSIADDIDLVWVKDFEQAKQALARERFSLVITDFLLTGSDGTGGNVWEHCKETHPETPILMMSGHSCDTIRRFLGQAPEAELAYIGKPFLFKDCKAYVQRLLAAN